MQERITTASGTTINIATAPRNPLATITVNQIGQPSVLIHVSYEEMKDIIGMLSRAWLILNPDEEG